MVALAQDIEPGYVPRNVVGGTLTHALSVVEAERGRLERTQAVFVPPRSEYDLPATLWVIVDEASTAKRIAARWAQLAVDHNGAFNTGAYRGSWHLGLNLSHASVVELVAKAEHQWIRAEERGPTCTCSHEDGSCERHATPCPCAERGECLDSCVCGGDGTRQPDTAPITCWCREVAAELAGEDALDEYENRRAG
jgi:hypothetical protein